MCVTSMCVQKTALNLEERFFHKVSNVVQLNFCSHVVIQFFAHWAHFALFVLQFASRISGMRFCEASAKDNFNVDEIFLKLVDDILSKVGALAVEPHRNSLFIGW